MSSIKIRYTYGKLDGLDEKTVRDFILSLKPTKYYLAVEQGQDPPSTRHVQGWVQMVQKRNYLVNNIQKFTDKYHKGYKAEKGKANAYYSTLMTVEQDGRLPSEYIGYLMKEDKNAVHNLTDDQLEYCRLVKEDYDKNKALQESRRRAEKKLPVMKQMLVSFREHYPNKATLDEVINFVYDYYIENDKVIMEGHMKNQIQTIATRYVDGYDMQFKYKLMKSVISSEYRELR